MITSAGGIVVGKRGSVCCILLLQYVTGRLAFPKGRVEKGESMEETALREVQEETGAEGLTLFQKLGEVSYRSANPAQSHDTKTMHLYLMTATAMSNQREEGHTPVWVPLKEAQQKMELPGERELLVRHEGLLREHVSIVLE